MKPNLSINNLMKLTFLKNVKLALLLTTGIALAVTSCTKAPDSEVVPDDPNTNIGVLANFDWSTTKTVTVRIPVEDLHSGQFFYKLELFDREPYLPGAVLLGGGVAKNGQDLSTKITVPSHQTKIFVQKTTPLGDVSFSILDIANSQGIVNAKVGSINLNGVAKLASSTPVSSIAPSVPSIPSNALEVSGKENITTIPASKSYVIRAGQTLAGNIPALNSDNEGLTVYVEGKWHHYNDVELGKNTRVVVLPGGVFDVKSLALNSGTASFENHGDVLLKALKINTNNSFKSVGTLRIEGNVAMVGNAEFVNYQKDVKVKIFSLTMVDAGSVVTNNGEIEILEGSFKNGTLNANCYTTVGKMEAVNATVNIWNDAMLDVTILTAQGGDFNLYSKSILDVTKNATFSANSVRKPVGINTIGADAANRSYVRIKYVDVNSSKNVHLAYNGYLSIITDEHPKQNEGVFTVNGTSVEIFWDLYNHPPYIAATSCNAGGAGIKPINPPVNQELKEVKLGAHTFLFEDNWPKEGDYDLNDLVLAVDVTKFLNKSNKVEKLILKNTIYAVGASRRMAAAIQLDNVLSTAVKSVKYSQNTLTGTTIPLVNGIESNQSKAVMTIADDVHKAFGLTSAAYIFTHNKAYQPLVTEMVIEFNSPQDDISFADLNPFIINPYGGSAGKRYEVHLVGFAGTDKLDTQLVSNEQAVGGLLSPNDPFKTSKGWPFAISVPVAEFKYQTTEGKNIAEAYSQFSSWVSSGGTNNQDWYLFPTK